MPELRVCVCLIFHFHLKTVLYQSAFLMNEQDLSDFPVIDNATLAELRRLMAGGFPDLVKTLLRDLPLQLAAIQDAIRQGDAEALYRAAHKLKSGSGSMGALRLSELARQLEMWGRHRQLTGLTPLLEQFQATAEQTQRDFQALLDT